jgi:2'-5' RNA ligase
MARHFFALWPDETAAGKLAEVGRDLAAGGGGRAAPREKIHLTLAFLGEIDADRVRDAAAIGARMRSPPLALLFDVAGSFRKARVAWAGCARMPEGLRALQLALEEALRDGGFALDERPYVPHLTLVRKIERPTERRAIGPIAWEARDLALVRSEAGTGRYVDVERWALGRDKSP